MNAAPERPYLTAADAATAGIGRRSAGDGARVVIADDERDTVDLLALLIGLEGYEVYVGYDGEHALALIDRLRPPAAVIDLAMPKLNGFEIARRVRQSAAHSRMRLAAVSGWGRSDDVERALAAGFDAHFIKPADFDALMRWLGTAVAGGGRA